MRPPPIVYILCALALAGLILSSVWLVAGGLLGVSGAVVIFVMGGLSFYFCFFALKRIKYDRLQTGKTTELAGDTEIAEGETLQLCQIEGGRAVKVGLKLFCNRYEPDESFPVQIMDKQGRVVAEDAFVPAFGRFHLETEIAGDLLPLKVVVRNTAKVPRKIRSRVRYAEIVK